MRRNILAVILLISLIFTLNNILLTSGFADSYDCESGNHDYGSTEATLIVIPTCDDPGKTVEQCSICGEINEVISPATGHSYGRWIVGKKANLFTDGHMYKVCEFNETHIVDDIIPKGITSEVTPVAIGLNLGSLVLIILWIVMIGSEFRIIKWERAERIKREKLLAQERGPQ